MKSTLKCLSHLFVLIYLSFASLAFAQIDKGGYIRHG